MTKMIQAIAMPKWGLAMTEGKVVGWLVAPGASIAKNDEIVEIETTKITNVMETPAAGILRRRVVEVGETVPVGALLGVIADLDVTEAEIDAFVAQFVAEVAEETDVAAAPEPLFVDVDGRRLRYLRMGEGGKSPALLLHGFGADLNSWMFNQPKLAERTATYALTLPGHGDSSKDVGAGDVAALTQTVEAFLRELGIERAHLIGHSLGGAVALELALREPALAASVTLVSSAGLGREINGEFISGFIEASRRKQLQPVLEMLVHDPSLINRDMIEEVLKFKRLDGAEDALRRIAATAFTAGAQTLDLSDRLGELATEAQVIWGKEDRIIPASHASRLPDRIRARVIEGAGHMPHMEKAGEVNALILDLVG